MWHYSQRKERVRSKQTMRQPTKKVRRARNRAILTLISMGVLFYLSSSQQITDIERIKNNGVITMLTTPGPTTYFEDGRGKNGFEYIIARAFADSIGVALNVQTKSSLRGLLLAIGGPQGDFAAANIVETALRSKTMQFSTPYLETSQLLIYQRGSNRPISLQQIDGDLLVITGSSHSERLTKMAQTLPELEWREQDNLEMFELMEMVHNGEIDYAVVDSLAYLVNRHIYPNAALAFEITEPQLMAWAFPTHGDGTVLKAANDFLDAYIATGKLAALEAETLSHSDSFSVADSKRLGELVVERLPDYEQLFRQTAETYALDWHLLAAVAYQESHWNPRARSPTGVRGLMMLTLNTAREMKVSSRLDAKQSIEGGTAYLMKLKQRLPKRINEPDRTLFSLAAYNVGFGHLEDARILTQKSGKNPDRWQHVRQFLPLLSHKEYYSKSKYGYARGAEPVLYVDNIQYYQHYLQLYSLSQNKRTIDQTDISGREKSWEENKLPTL